MKERIWAVKFDTPGNKLYGEGRSKTDYGGGLIGRASTSFLPPDQRG